MRNALPDRLLAAVMNWTPEHVARGREQSERKAAYRFVFERLVSFSQAEMTRFAVMASPDIIRHMLIEQAAAHDACAAENLDSPYRNALRLQERSRIAHVESQTYQVDSNGATQSPTRICTIRLAGECYAA